MFLIIPGRTIFASELEKKDFVSSTPISLTLEEIDKYNEYIDFDEENLTFVIKGYAQNFLNKNDLRKIESNINYANNIIQLQSKNPMAHMIVANKSSTFTNQVILATTYHEGVTKVETHWWGVKVYISKTDVKNVGRLYEYGGLLATLASGPLAVIVTAMGMVMSDVPGGFSFNVTWPQVPTLPVLAMNPLTVATIIATWSWQ